MSCVTKVTVSFENFCFCVHFQQLLKMEDVSCSVADVLEEAAKFHALEPFFCFIRFSEEELQTVSTTLTSVGCPGGDVKQIPSKHSILILSSNQYWKYIPHSKEMGRVEKVNAVLRQEKAKFILPYSNEVWLSDMRLFAFPAQMSPLKRKEVGECLGDFLTRTADALEELHSLGFAHLDVRIPNICFF